jgi:hypothetical protein
MVNEHQQKIEIPPKFRPIIELKGSTVKVEGKVRLTGVLAATRFEHGDIITIQHADEKP